MCAEFEFRHAGRCAIRQGKAFGVSLANQGTAGLDLVRSQGDIGGVLEHDLPPLATLVADAEDPLAHEFLEAVPGFDAVELDRLVRPLADQPELSPLRNRLAAATMRARVHRVELIEGDLLERIVLVHVERDRVQSTKEPVGASGYWDAQRVVAELAPEFLDVVGFELARHEDEIEVALDELDGAETSGVRRRDREGYF